MEVWARFLRKCKVKKKKKTTQDDKTAYVQAALHKSRLVNVRNAQSTGKWIDGINQAKKSIKSISVRENSVRKCMQTETVLIK